MHQAHKGVEGFRVDAVLLGGEIVPRGSPLQHPSKTLLLLFRKFRLKVTCRKISLELVDPLCGIYTPLCERNI